MRSANLVVLIGNITRDPVLKQTATGQAIVSFGLATNRYWVTKDGSKKSSTEYHQIVGWSRLAEIVATRFKKGDLVYVQGYLKTRTWDREDGTRAYQTEIVMQEAFTLKSIGDRANGEQAGDEEMYSEMSSEEEPPEFAPQTGEGGDGQLSADAALKDDEMF